MPGIIVAPDLDKVVIQRQGIFSVMRDDAVLECNCPHRRGPCGGIEIGKIPLQWRSFELLCTEMGKRFIERQRPRGYDWVHGNLFLHGPWPSKVQNMQDASAPIWTQAMNRSKEDDMEHPELILGAVSDSSLFTHMDYVLVGDFLFKDKMTDLELPG